MKHPVSNIPDRISEFLSQEDGNLHWLRPAVAKHRFLPLYVGWLSTLGITCDGVIVRIDTEPSSQPTPEKSPFYQRMAIMEGAKKYPEFRNCLPQRPQNAVVCRQCNGVGTVAGAPDLICECAGFGWQVPGEDRGDSPG